MPPPRPPRAGGAQPTDDPTDELYTSAPITDRASVFTAHFSPHPTLDPRRLQRLPALTSADHRILAWRRPSRQATLSFTTIATPTGSPTRSRVVGPPRLDTGSDDDGERWAGARLLQVLEREGVVGAVVVGRVYGGVMLGPARFRWIEQCAEEAVRKWKSATSAKPGSGVPAAKRPRPAAEGGVEEGPVARKQKVEGAEASGLAPPPSILESPSRRLAAKATMSPVELNAARRELAAQLPERDANIAVLRKLLEGKKARLDPELQNSPSKPSPIAQPPEYASLSLARLQHLERARDLTVAYLLKELDKVDKKLQEEEELESAMLVAEELSTPKKPARQPLKNQRVVSKVEADELLDLAWGDLDEALKGD
jgi:hypothetical protein